MENETKSMFELDSEISRRYWREEARPPDKLLDDGVFRQTTLAEEMTRGTAWSERGQQVEMRHRGISETPLVQKRAVSRTQVVSSTRSQAGALAGPHLCLPSALFV